MAGSSPPATSGRIFISYRREETAYPAGWLYDRLAGHFGGGQVFKDVDSIQLGDDFVEVITRAVGSCDVLVALIGGEWLSVTDAHGRRRLDDPDDFVRLEIEAALSRGVRVIPVLVDGARMPPADELPDSLAALVRRQALELSPARFDFDTSRLLKVLDRTLAEVRATRPHPVLRPAPAGTAPDPSPEAPEQREQAGQSPTSGIAPAAPAPPAGPRSGRPRRGVLLAVAAAAVAVAGGVIAALVLLTGGSGGNSPTSGNFHTSGKSVTASAPWRLKVDDRISGNDNGCTITLTDAHSGQRILLPGGLYGTSMWQIHQTGSFRWQVNDPGCLVAAVAGPGTDKLPLAWPAGGDSDAFAAPPRVAVQVKDYNGNSECLITLRDPANGQQLDFARAERDINTVMLNPGGRRRSYLGTDNCGVRVSAAGGALQKLTETAGARRHVCCHRQAASELGLTAVASGVR